MHVITYSQLYNFNYNDGIDQCAVPTNAKVLLGKILDEICLPGKEK